MTAQISDKIIYNGKECKMHSNPMESYFAKYPAKRPKGDVQSTALWRGYVATFEIRDNQLCLKDIVIQTSTQTAPKHYEYGWKSVRDDIFPNQDFIKIDWLTGTLVLPSGKVVNYVHMGYASSYEHYTLLEIENGDLKSVQEFGPEEYRYYKEKQFQAFKQTEEYENVKNNLQDTLPEFDDEFVESFLRDFRIE